MDLGLKDFPPKLFISSFSVELLHWCSPAVKTSKQTENRSAFSKNKIKSVMPIKASNKETMFNIPSEKSFRKQKILPTLHYGIAFRRSLFVNHRERTGICRYFIDQSDNCTIMSDERPSS